MDPTADDGRSGDGSATGSGMTAATSTTSSTAGAISSTPHCHPQKRSTAALPLQACRAHAGRAGFQRKPGLAVRDSAPGQHHIDGIQRLQNDIHQLGGNGPLAIAQDIEHVLGTVTNIHQLGQREKTGTAFDGMEAAKYGIQQILVIGSLFQVDQLFRQLFQYFGCFDQKSCSMSSSTSKAMRHSIKIPG